MNFKSSFSILFLFMSLGIMAQTGELKNPLAFYADVMSNASVAEHRNHASAQFSELIEERLAQANSFEDDLEDLPWLFVRYDEENTFRFISWQVQIEDEEYFYPAFFQRSGENAIKLGQKSSVLDRRTQYDGSELYPAIIHRIQSFEDYYLLSAYRQIEGGKVQKIIDVLAFNDGEPLFGKPIFYENEEVLEGRGHKRVIMNYSSVASASLSVNLTPEENSIVYDHIIEVPGKLKGEGMVYVPDGTYEAYIHKGKNKWVYVANLYEGLEYNPKTTSAPKGRN